MNSRTSIGGFLLLLAFGCEPNITKGPPAPTIAIAQFDPVRSAIPLPNDLLLTQPVESLNLAPAQAELVTHFQQQGGFPNDQEVPITIGFTTQPPNGGGEPAAPQLDLNSFTDRTFFVAVTTSAQSGVAALDPITADDYVISGAVGTLSLHHQGRTPWPPGQYAVLVRGGPDGIKTADGQPVYASQIFYLIAQGEDLTAPQNIGLLAAQAGSITAATPQAQQLNGITSLFQQTGAFAACDAVFPHQQLAIGMTFKIAPAKTQVELDPGRGVLPLPIDLLRVPGPAGKLTPLAACTLAGGSLDSTGACSSAAAAGFAQLDGFATTGAILAPTSGLIRASTVTPETLRLYDLSDPARPVLVNPSTLITEPCEFTSSCDSNALSPVIAVQPAGASAGDGSSVFRTRPLKDATDYAVLITNGVLDKSGQPLVAGTVAHILTFQNPLVDQHGHSQLQGVDDLTASSLEVMRLQLQPVLATALRSGIGSERVAMAYTFRTQTILATAAQLAALPYAAAPGSFSTVTSLKPAAAFRKYGVDLGLISNGAISEVLEAKFVTLNLLDPATGAFLADPTRAAPESIDALISIPAAPRRNAQGLTPLVVFRHGLGGGRADMLTVANTFAARGIIVAAIDAAKHGDRSFCSSGTSSVTVGSTIVPICADGLACVSPLPAGAQGDAAPPGRCTGGFVFRPVSSSCSAPGSCNGFDPTAGGIPLVSGNFVVSANFFRTRDTFRQDILDQSQLIHVLAPVPSTPLGPMGNPVFDSLLAEGIVIDPASVGYVGQSLGSIQGVADVAANPRVGSAVFNVGGGTVVDVFTTSPAFTGSVGPLLRALGVVPGTSSYLQFLVLAKTVLDPADPVNFAGHLQHDTLPNLLITPSFPQSPKQVLAQMAYCDQVVPNPFSYVLDANLGTGPLPGNEGFGGPGTFQVFLTGTSAADAAALSKSCASQTAHWVNHGFLTDWANPLMTVQAQGDAAHFLLEGTRPGGLVIVPELKGVAP